MPHIIRLFKGVYTYRALFEVITGRRSPEDLNGSPVDRPYLTFMDCSYGYKDSNHLRLRVKVGSLIPNLGSCLTPSPC